MAQNAQYQPQYESPPDSFFDEPALQPGQVPAFQQDWSHQPARASGRHPIAVIFHLAFKIAAVIIYLFAYWVIKLAGSFVVAFILCILMLVFDFWTVKNVTGRLLVGLRWWNEIKEDGSNEWIYESLEETSQILPHESRLFWISMFVVPLLWVIFAIVSIVQLNLSWLLIDFVAIVLSIANIVGYVKCARDARKKLKTMASAYITNAVVSGAVQSTLNKV
eukprot:TRINITY_DN1967_c0_g3_i1.p1 TRINITY_DN1967_c0_g3~~TRINITY_DN1967_c0_g3_i1.p1  ORF type:complete len:220 (+),score=59.80 TRINITY_DN1967_c0_g3_i1:69-728(+)